MYIACMIETQFGYKKLTFYQVVMNSGVGTQTQS